MSERPRYLTDQELQFDGSGEGFGVSAEMPPEDKNENRPRGLGTQVEDSFRQFFKNHPDLGTATKQDLKNVSEFRKVFDEGVPSRTVHPLIEGADALLLHNREVFRPIREEALKELFAETHLEVMRMETDGGTGSKAPNTSPEESSK